MPSLCRLSLVLALILAPSTALRAQGTPAAAPATPPAPPPTLAEELAKNRLTLRQVDGQLEGPGAEWLAREAAESQFLLVAEDHGLAEMPEVTAALFDLARPAGYRHVVVEIGPLVAERFERMAAAPDALEHFATFSRDYPYGAAFFFWREEAAMLARIVQAMGGARDTVWGIDQEFIAAGAVHLERLVELAPDAAARALAERHLAFARQDMSRMMETKRADATFVASAPAELFAELRSVFAAAGPEAARIIDELARSAEIYRMNSDGRGWQSNFPRARLAKEHFRAYYDRALAAHGTPPRAVIKYGAMHLRRGRSPLGVHDIGNLASELAEFNGLRSFHLLVLCARGTVNAYHPFGDPPEDRRKPYAAAASFARMLDLQPLLAAADPAEWTLLDLRPVRRFLFRRYQDLDPGLKESIWGFDAVLVIPEGRAATLFE